MRNISLMSRTVYGRSRRPFRTALHLAIAVAIVLLLNAGWTTAKDVTVRKSDLFVARQGGYHTYRIPGIVVTGNGTLLAFATARDRDIWDYGTYHTVLRRSVDGGETWSPMEVLMSAGKSTVDNCVLIVDKLRKGVVHHLYCVDYAHTYYRRSTDDARTFSPPVEIKEPFAAFAKEYRFIIQATGPGHGIQLENGRLIVPVWLSPSKQQFPSAVSVIYSDDHGSTWRRGSIIVRSGDPPNHPMEGVVAQLSDGRVMMNIRNEGHEHRRAVSYSPNGATDWSVPQFDNDLREPICFASLLAVPRDIAGAKGVLLFCNPDNVRRDVNIGPAHYCDRKNVSVRLSLNDGRDWAKTLVIEPGFSGYSDLAIGSDGTVFCLYERGALSSYYDPQAVTLARFSLRDLQVPPKRGSAAVGSATAVLEKDRYSETCCKSLLPNHFSASGQ
jgi:sialidase-1